MFPYPLTHVSPRLFLPPSHDSIIAIDKMLAFGIVHSTIVINFFFLKRSMDTETT
jgi:hypothetical protein